MCAGLKGDKGLKGDTGDKGPRGPTGNAGKDGKNDYCTPHKCKGEPDSTPFDDEFMHRRHMCVPHNTAHLLLQSH